MIDKIVIKGANQHNLKNISLELPKEKMVVFTGVSGSGKSSLAFDTIYAEGQRRYVESLSSYARQFLGIMDKPDVESISGLSPAISIDQKSASHNPRSTVGTVTEIYDYLRLLFARIGHPHCPNCGREIQRQTKDQIVIKILQQLATYLGERKNKYARLAVLSPVVRDRKGEFSALFGNLRSKGFTTVRIDNIFYNLDEEILLIKTNKHTIDVVCDRLTFDLKTVRLLQSNTVTTEDALKKRLNDAVEQALTLSNGLVISALITDKGFDMPQKPQRTEDTLFSEKFSCPVCNINIPDIEPRTFSFNSPHGACPVCTGIGSIATVDPDLVMAWELSISEGAIIPFAKMFINDTWYARVINTVCEKHQINPKIPVKNLPHQQIDILFNGTGDQEYIVRGTNRFGDMTSIQETFPGISNELKRRYKESKSEYVRAEIEKFMRDETCQECRGQRLKKQSLTVTITGKSISEITALNIPECLSWIRSLSQDAQKQLTVSETAISKPIIKELVTRLNFLANVGLEYLTLARGATSLSGGEAQRIRLASQIGSGLSGVLYVLDEPSIGLHPRDNSKLISTLRNLVNLGNTVLVVEHDRETILAGDYLVDFGPGAGEHGGQIVAQGTPEEIRKDDKSITGAYLSGKKRIRLSKNTRQLNNNFLEITGVEHNNLKNINAKIPLGLFVCVTGVSGSGKSSLIVDTLYQAIFNHFHPYSKNKPGKFREIKGVENLDKIILVDQSPIGRTPRSNPATYTGIFGYIRELFAALSESKLRGYTAGRFSFNVKGGRCEACEGEGMRKIEMQFLSDVYVTCEVCHGTRYNSETLDIDYHGKNISDVLAMTFEEGIDFFRNHPAINEKIKTIVDVGLGYMHLGQPATTLSGGEAQRVKLATELMRRQTGKTMYILDEPTTGLHFADLEKLLEVLHKLSMMGNTVLVIEHNLDVIKNSDYIIDLGPEGGDQGGYLVYSGYPEEITKKKDSYTGKFLAKEQLK